MRKREKEARQIRGCRERERERERELKSGKWGRTDHEVSCLLRGDRRREIERIKAAEIEREIREM